MKSKQQRRIEALSRFHILDYEDWIVERTKGTIEGDDLTPEKYSEYVARKKVELEALKGSTKGYVS